MPKGFPSHLDSYCPKLIGTLSLLCCVSYCKTNVARNQCCKILQYKLSTTKDLARKLELTWEMIADAASYYTPLVFSCTFTRQQMAVTLDYHCARAKIEMNYMHK